MSGTLYVVATPIGNLEDITLRALRVLRESAVIAAEDTRRTAGLLAHHGIRASTVSFHDHNSSRRMPELVRRLQEGQSVALVSDAGTPLVSDPGLELVQACIEAGVPVVAVPGPSAPLAALVASGFSPQPVTLLGFAPSRSNSRKIWLSEVAAIRHAVVFFETPHRIRALLADCIDILGNRLLCVARELTKVHEEVLRGTASQLAERLNIARGELTVVVAPREEDRPSSAVELSPELLFAEFRQMTDSGGLTRRAAVSALSRRYGRSSREVYALIESAKGPLS